MSGGGSPAVQAPQDNSIQLEQMRQSEAQRERERIAAEKAQAKTDFQASLGTAVSGARNTGRDYFAQRGLAPDDYASLIDSIIGDTRLKVPELDANPASYFTSDAFASGIDNAQNVKRSNLTGKVNSTFAPGFEKNLISDTADDSILESILGGQRGQAQQQIDFNRKRGVLNDAGYSTVMSELGGQENAARATLTGIGDSILGKNRQDLLNIRGDAGNAASGFQFGMPEPNVNDYYTQAQTKAQSGIGGLEGSIRSALGSTNLFDVPTLLQKGGTAQGPINLTTADASTALPFDPKKSNTKRGLGSTGVF
jgi:hypothetical protein